MDAWKTRPGGLGDRWDMRKWVEVGWSLRYIFNYALALHGRHQQQVGTLTRGRKYPAREWSGFCGDWDIGWCSRS